MSEPSGLEWATLAVGIATAAGTISAAVVAAWLGFVQVRRFRRERRDADLAARRAQAERVTAWVHRSGGEYSAPAVEVLNASDQPIYEAKIHIHRGDLGSSIVVQLVGFIPPGDRGHVHTDYELPTGSVSEPVVVVFRDAAGLWWMRDETGIIAEHDSDPWPLPAGNSVLPRHSHVMPPPRMDREALDAWLDETRE